MRRKKRCSLLENIKDKKYWMYLIKILVISDGYKMPTFHCTPKDINSYKAEK
jgi:predicted RNA-binding protein associated with RNAse of E/G family